jgi:hypothetical protein
MLLTLAKNHSSYPILENGISSFRQSYNNDSNYHHQHYHSESSPSITDPNYIQNQGSNLDTMLLAMRNGTIAKKASVLEVNNNSRQAWRGELMNVR